MLEAVVVDRLHTKISEMLIAIPIILKHCQPIERNIFLVVDHRIAQRLSIKDFKIIKYENKNTDDNEMVVVKNWEIYFIL